MKQQEWEHGPSARALEGHAYWIVLEESDGAVYQTGGDCLLLATLVGMEAS